MALGQQRAEQRAATDASKRGARARGGVMRKRRGGWCAPLAAIGMRLASTHTITHRERMATRRAGHATLGGEMSWAHHQARKTRVEEETHEYRLREW